MTEKRQAAVMEAIQLTRAGRLSEATSLIQRSLGLPVSHPPAVDDPGAGPVRTAMVDSHPRLRSLSPEALSADLMRGLAAGTSYAAARAEAQSTLPGRFLERSYKNAAGERAYKIYVPSGYSGQTVPLVVMLHGGTQSADDFAAGTAMNAVGERETFLVVYPEQSRSANTMGYWNWFQPADQYRGGGEPSLIAGITREVAREFTIDAGRIYIAGFSAGGAMSAVMAATYPDLYAAAGVHSGLAYGVADDIPSAFAAMRGTRMPPEAATGFTPLIVFHGDRDPTVDPINADWLVRQGLRSAAAAGRHPVQKDVTGDGGHSRTTHRDANGVPLVEQWTVHGAAHAWSGGSPSGSYTDPGGPDASAELVRFFREQSKKA